jgi:hypothetical protein
VLRAAGETETTQEDIKDWLQLDEGDPGFQVLAFLQFLNKGSTVIFFISISATLIIEFSIYLFFKFSFIF